MGHILAAELLVAADDFSAYATEGHIASAAGMVPVSRDSGTRTGNINVRPKRYSRPLQRALFLAAQAACLHWRTRPAGRALAMPVRTPGRVGPAPASGASPRRRQLHLRHHCRITCGVWGRGTVCPASVTGRPDRVPAPSLPTVGHVPSGGVGDQSSRTCPAEHVSSGL
ncbi:transposase [Streptomyces flaveolus]|uniref:transposase n=1 Tax=Streptomyces flaveolus TaxID=67297 RepID=UPI00369ED706